MRGHIRTKQTILKFLLRLQHYGGKTNLIDFTANYKVALFFACSGEPDKDGRVIIVQKTDKVEKIACKYPLDLVKRAADQKSVFVQPPKGYIERERYEVICIPKDLKLGMLRYLHRREINPQTIYNDIHGFISRDNAFWMVYREFESGLTSQNKGDYGEAIKYYTNALEQGLQPPEVYNNRGNTYLKMDKIDKAVNDFSKAIEIKSDSIEAYNNRGNAHATKGNFDEAVDDYSEAIRLNPSFDEAYKNRGIAYLNKGDLSVLLKILTRRFN